MANPDSAFRRWLRGEVDLSAELRTAEMPVPPEEARYQPRHHTAMIHMIFRQSHRFYVALVAVLCVVLFTVLLLAAANLPAYGDSEAPTNNEVTERYVNRGVEETGAVNAVAGLILDYRAFDTLGESFVLFTALCAVTILMSRGRRKHPLPMETDYADYYADPIVHTMCKVIIPVILVFGVYVLVNGHLSPGGGFSGGAILSSALIIYAMVWGDERAHGTIRERAIRRTAALALGFYVVSKTYSFYTGANGLHSVISPGVPGRIFSAGLILPLNVAVGLVVCCTMYSFYMFFRRGEL